MIGLLFIPLAFYVVLLLFAYSGSFGLSLDKTLKLSDLPGLAATTLVAVVLQYVLLKRGKATDSEKDLLADQAMSILESLSKLRDMIGKFLGKNLTSDDAVLLTQAFDLVSEDLSSLRFCLENSHCQGLVDAYDQLENDFLLYKGVVTGGNFPAAPLTSSTVARASQARVKLDKGLRMLSLDIGKQ